MHLSTINNSNSFLQKGTGDERCDTIGDEEKEIDGVDMASAMASGRNGALLSLLAEVASQKLHNEISTKRSPPLPCGDPSKPVKNKSSKVTYVAATSDRDNERKRPIMPISKASVKCYGSRNVKSPSNYSTGIGSSTREDQHAHSPGLSSPHQTQMNQPLSSGKSGSTGFGNSIGSNGGGGGERGSSWTSQMTAEQVRALSATQLVKLFTVLEDDEMKRTFYFRCRFMPAACQKRFFSFGSEEKARHLVKQHLMDHVKQLTADSLIQVPSKYDCASSKKNLKRQTMTAALNNTAKLMSNKQTKHDKRKAIVIKSSADEIGGKKLKTADNETGSKNHHNNGGGYITIIANGNNSGGKTKNGNTDTKDHNYYRFLNVSNSSSNSNKKPAAILTRSSPTDMVGDNDAAIHLNRNKTASSASNINNINNNSTSNYKNNSNNIDGANTDVPNLLYDDRRDRQNINVNCNDNNNHHVNDDDDNDGGVTLVPIQTSTVVDVTTGVQLDVDYITPVIHEEVVNTENENDFAWVSMSSNGDDKVKVKIEVEEEEGGEGEEGGRKERDVPANEEDRARAKGADDRQDVVNRTISKSVRFDETDTIKWIKKESVHNSTTGGGYEMISKLEYIASCQDKKPKGKAKFIGRSAEEREMAVEMIKALKRGGGGLECQICQPKRVFTAPTTLITHYRSHAGIKPYECLLCKAAFTRQHSLNYHLLIHLNQTRFTCDVCGRKFRHPSHFKEHQRRHTGESPFHCPDCSHRFKTRNTYKRHLKTRHGKILSHLGTIYSIADSPNTTTASITAAGENVIASDEIAKTESSVVESSEFVIKVEKDEEDIVVKRTLDAVTTTKEKQHDSVGNVICNSDDNANIINGNNDLDKENDSNCSRVAIVNNFGGNKRPQQGLTINDILTKRAAVSVVRGLNMKQQNHNNANSIAGGGVGNNMNAGRGTILLSIVPTLQQRLPSANFVGIKKVPANNNTNNNVIGCTDSGVVNPVKIGGGGGTPVLLLTTTNNNAGTNRIATGNDGNGFVIGINNNENGPNVHRINLTETKTVFATATK